MDNVVRLKFKNDPNPGECRTGQLNTLPVTIQGLPKDSAESNSWHLEDICDGLKFCPCKKSKVLTPVDIKPVVLDMNADEKSFYSKFEKMCTGNSSAFWTKISESGSWPKLIENSKTAAFIDEPLIGETCNDDNIPDYESIEHEVCENESMFHLVEITSNQKMANDMEQDHPSTMQTY